MLHAAGFWPCELDVVLSNFNTAHLSWKPEVRAPLTLALLRGHHLTAGR
jgi:hypothetical protein